MSVAKSYATESGGRKVVFRPATLCLPTNRRLAILGAKKSGKTTLLEILAGKILPDAGHILVPHSLSPVANAGNLFHPNLSLVENIRFVARAYSLDVETLALTVLILAGRGARLEAAFNVNDFLMRRRLETAMIVTLPFACHLIDDLGQLPIDFVERVRMATFKRGGGLIFSTVHTRVVRQHADAIVVIAEGAIYPFADIEEGIEFFERHSR